MRTAHLRLLLGELLVGEDPIVAEVTGTRTSPRVHDVGVADGAELLRALRVYRSARRAFLEALGCQTSNRDPLAEFAERLAATLLDGAMATNRVQRGWDFMTPTGRRVQVRYLANPAGEWVNGHVVDFRGDECDLYALLVVEDLDPVALLVFEKGGLFAVGAKLGKRHGNQETTLQLGRANYRAIAAAPGEFEPHGARYFDLRPPVEGTSDS